VPADGAKNGWSHYGSQNKFDPDHCGIEIWPDMREYPVEDRFPTNFRHADGSVATVFSSVRESTIRLHFQWMKTYGIDGIFLQRFAVSARDPRFREPMDAILSHCAKAAAESGRGWGLMVDLTGIKVGAVAGVITDLKRLVSEKRLPHRGSDSQYFCHNGKPILAFWGCGFEDRDPMLDEWHQLLDFAKNDPEFGGFSILLGVPYHWRTGKGDAIADPKLQAVIAKADILSPWSVGRMATPQDAENRVKSQLTPDLKKCQETGQEYLPVAFPGFSWQNLMRTRGQDAPFDAIPRLGGKFLWAQALAARKAGANALYIAMFDEMDEATAIFKTTADPPVGKARFLTDPKLPSDHYLWLTGQIGRLLRDEIPQTPDLPTRTSAGEVQNTP
jgi:hypothetical protein